MIRNDQRKRRELQSKKPENYNNLQEREIKSKAIESERCAKTKVIGSYHKAT